MLADALDRIEDMVIKQRTGSGGYGVDDLRARERARSAPRSTAPCASARTTSSRSDA